MEAAEEIDPIAAQIAAEQQGAAPSQPPSPPMPPAPPAPDVDPIATQIRAEQQQADAQAASLMRYRAANAKEDPARQADVLRYSTAAGVDPEYVGQHLDEVRKQVDASGVDWPKVVERQPILTKLWLNRPEITPVVRDDVSKLGVVEWAFKAPWAALRDASVEQVAIARELGELTGLGGEANRQRIRELEAQYGGTRDYGAGNWLSQAYVGTFKALPMLAGDVGARALGGILGAGAAAAAGIETGPGAAITGVAGFGAGQFAGSALFNTAETAGPLYWRLSEMKDANGNKMDPALARAMALSGGGIAGALMAGLGGKLATSFLPKSLLSRLGAVTVEKALLTEGTGALLRRGLARYGQHVLSGAAMMAAQSATTAASEESAKAVSGQPFDVHWENVATAGAQGFRSGLVDFLFLAAHGPVREYMAERGLVAKAAQDRVQLESMTDAARESVLLKHMPEAFQRLMQEGKAENGAPQDVHIPTEDWNRYWQEKKVDPAAMARELVGDDGRAYAEATQAGTNLAIPIERYVARLAPTEHARGLSDYARFDPEAPTPKAAREAAAQDDAKLREAAALPEEEMAEGQRQVLNDFRRKAMAAGTPKAQAEANAKIAAAVFQRWSEGISEKAAQTGEAPVSAWELYQPYSLRIHHGPTAPERLPVGIEEAKTAIARMRPDNREAATAWLEYTQGQREERPPVTPDMERQLAEFGVVDPQGYSYDESGRDMARELGDPRTFGEEPDALREHRLRLKDVYGRLTAAEIAHRPLGNRFEQAQRVRWRTETAPHLEAEYRSLNEAGRQALYYRDPTTGLLHERAVRDLPVDPERPNYGVITFAFKKGINDTLGHDALDAVFRDIGRLIHEEDPLAAKVGGDFWLPAVKDRAQVEALLSKVRARLNGELPPGLKDLPIVGTVVPREGGKTWAETKHRVGDALDEYVERQRAEYPNERREGQPRYPPRNAKAPDIAGQTVKGKGVAAPIPDVLLEKHAGLSHYQVAMEAFVEPGSGLLTKAGWDVIRRRNPKPFVASADLRAVATMDTVLGHEATDDLVQLVAQRFNANGGHRIDLAHVSGDEFRAQANSKDELDKFFTAVRNEIQNAKLRLEGESGRLYVQKGLHFAYGIGRGRDAEHLADAIELPRAKAVNLRDKQWYAGRTETIEPEAREAYLAEHGNRWSGLLHQARSGDDQAHPGHVLSELEGAPAAGEGQEVAPTFKLEKKGERGFITFGSSDGGEPRKFDIHLLKNADASTLAHETLHFLSHVMGDVVSRADAPEAVKRDYQALLGWMGHASHEEREAHAAEMRDLSALETRTPEQEARLNALAAKEERVTHGWEQYLLEGKEPSAELAGAFGRFKRWLTGIYRGILGVQEQYRAQYGEDIGLSEDVRGVFQRLLASEDEIARTQAAQEAQPLQAALEGMTPEMRVQYEKAHEEARTQAEDELFRRITEDSRGENAAWMRKERERVTADVNAELDGHPIYRALRYLQEGDSPEAPGQVPELLRGEDGGPMKLNRAELVRKYGADFVRTLPRGILAEKGKGESAERLAPLLGFDDGDAMVRQLQAAKPRDDVVAAQTKERLESLYGPSLLDNHEALSEAALGAAQGDAQARKVLLEVRGLAKQLGADAGATMADPQALQESARRLVEARTVRDVTSGDEGIAGRYLKTERSAARRAFDAAAKGNLSKAYDEKQTQLLNHYLYREAKALREEMQRATDKVKAAASDTARAKLGKADPAYRTGLDGILSALGMGGQGGLKSIDGLVAKATADAQDVAFDVDGINQLLASPKAWGALNAGEARNVLDAIINIRHIGNRLTEVVLAGKRQAQDAWFAELQATASEGRAPISRPYSRTAEGAKHKVAAWGRGADALLSDTETMASLLDQQKREGPATRLLVDARLEARAKEVELQKRVLEPIRKAFEHIPPEVRKLQGKPMPEVADILPLPRQHAGQGFTPEYTRDNLWMLFLNWGNEGNRQRVRDGNGWGDGQVEKALGLLTSGERKFLQGVLDTADSLFPDLAAVHEQRTGLPLEKVKASPIRIGGEEYAGGYFPLKYDSRVTKQGAVQEADVVSALFPQGYAPPYVGAGHRKARAANVNAPVDLTWGVVPAHFAQVIHDISYGDWVRQTGRLMMDERFKQVANGYLGPERTAQMVPWLRDVANARADSTADQAAGILRNVGGFMRSRMALGAMGLNIPNLISNITDPLNAAAAGVGRRFITTAYLKSLSPEARAQMVALSPELQYRQASFRDNLRKTFSEMGPTKGVFFKAASETLFKLHEMLDHFTTAVTFKAGYDQALSEGKTQEEAVQFGDDAVRRTAPSHDIAEKAKILRTKTGLAAAIMFYGYSNKMYNLNRRAFNVSAMHGAATMMWLSVVGAGAQYLAGRGWSKDEDESPTEWGVKKLLLEPFNTLPFIGGVLEGVVQGRARISVRNTPELAQVEETANRLNAAIRAVKAGDVSAEDKLWGTIETLAGAMGPMGQAHRTVGYLHQLSTGETQARNPFDFASGLLYGQRPKQGANPFSTASELIEGR